MRYVRIALVLSLTFLATAWAPRDAAALTFTIDAAGDSQAVSWTFTVGANTLTAQGLFTATSVSSSLIDLDVSITNSTLSSLNERVASIGFETNPGVTASFLSVGSVFDGLENDVTLPSFQTIEVCAFAGNNCSGGGFAGLLAPGVTDSFTLRLAGDFGSSPLLVLDTFGIKFQGDLGSFQFEGNGGNGTVPAPATVILLGMSILGMWLVARRP